MKFFPKKRKKRKKRKKKKKKFCFRMFSFLFYNNENKQTLTKVI